MVNRALLLKGLKINDSAICKIPKGVKVQYRAPCVLGRVDLKSHISIGAYTYFEAGRIGSLRSIGNYCSVAPGCAIGNGNHPTDYLTTHPIGFCAAGLFGFDEKTKNYSGGVPRQANVLKCAPIIGHDVWIAGNVTILRGVRIGNGVIIGANTLVNADIPDFSVVVGSPMRIIRKRFSESQIDKLQILSWWDYDILDLPDLNFSDIDVAIEQISLAISTGSARKISAERPLRIVEF